MLLLNIFSKVKKICFLKYLDSWLLIPFPIMNVNLLPYSDCVAPSHVSRPDPNKTYNFLSNLWYRTVLPFIQGFWNIFSTFAQRFSGTTEFAILIDLFHAIYGWYACGKVLWEPWRDKCRIYFPPIEAGWPDKGDLSWPGQNSSKHTR